MESNPLRGLVEVCSPQQVEQRVDPQPIEPTENENVYYEIPSGMLENLLANPFAGDGAMHPDEHLIYVDEVCGLFKLAGDTFVLHHAFISIFVALWAVITHYVTILMPILSYFTRFT